jgi:arsenate reductase
MAQASIVKKRRVLVVCSGNSARSQMAEALIRHEAGDVFEVSSAGTHLAQVRAEAVAVMRDFGIDISTQRSKPLTEFEGQKFDVVITVCDRASGGMPDFLRRTGKASLALRRSGSIHRDRRGTPTCVP